MTVFTAENWSSEMSIDDAFGELGEDCKVAIDRKEPEWCSGHMRTVNYDPSEPISLDWIQRRFGGEKLTIRLYGPKNSKHKNGYIGSRTLDIFGPPMDGFGIELTQGPDGKSVRVTELQSAIDRYNQKMGRPICFD